MIAQAAEFLNLSEAMFWHGVAVFLRVGAFIGLLPGFGETAVPARVKLGLALVLTLPVAASQPEFMQVGQMDSFLWFLLTETLSGAVLGVSIRLFVHGLQTAGSIAAQATSLSQMFGVAGTDPQPAIGHVLVVSGLAFAMLMGLHIKAVSFLILSYQLFPPGQLIDAALVSQWGVALVAKVFSLAFVLAFPFVIVSVLYNLTLGVINRAMPQLMVAFVGAPVITFGGLALLLLMSPVILQVWLSALDAHLSDPSGALR